MSFGHVYIMQLETFYAANIDFMLGFRLIDMFTLSQLRKKQPIKKKF